MKSQDLDPFMRAAIAAATLLSPLVSSGLPPRVPAEVEGDFGQSSSGECLPGQHTVYMRPPHPGSTTRAVSREPSTLVGRLSLVKRRIEHPDSRASITSFDVFDAFTPDQKACR